MENRNELNTVKTAVAGIPGKNPDEDGGHKKGEPRLAFGSCSIPA
jgi:hypothetical protein